MYHCSVTLDDYVEGVFGADSSARASGPGKAAEGPAAADGLEGVFVDWEAGDWCFSVSVCPRLTD